METKKCFLDGNALCVVGKDFTNLQGSKALFITLDENQLNALGEI